MKQIIKIISCASNKLKKYFFNKEIDHLSANCNPFFSIHDNEQNNEELSREHEYFDNYNATTRWQTV